MKKTLITLSLLIMIFSFSGCSWIENFILINNSNNEVEVTYELDSSFETYAIFKNLPTAYKVSTSGSIDWGENLTLEDTDTSFYRVQIILPPKSALDIGSISNSKYVSYTENETDFNLLKMTLTSKTNNIEILPANFDDYFKKKDNGNIEYIIQQ